jgi:hypothetical protein
MNLPEALLASLLIGLGTARASAIITIDVISEPLRDLIFHWFPPEDNDEAGLYYQQLRKATDIERRQQSGWSVPWYQKRWAVSDTERKATFIGKLFSCQKCIGVWVAAGNTALYLVWPDGALVLNVFLAASFIGAVANLRYYR